MASLAAPNYLSRQPIEQAVRALSRTLHTDAVVYDVGCGQKPYAPFFSRHRFIGVDIDSVATADVTYDGATIPLPDNSADVVICTQTLQHSEDPQRVMNEIYRLLKPGSQALITVPFGIKTVAQPRSAPDGSLWRDDYWRFTKFGLLLLLKRFQVVSIYEATGYIGTLLQLINYAIASLNPGPLAKPLYLILNCLAVFSDSAVRRASHHLPRGTFFYDTVYTSFTSNYIALIKKS